MKSQQRNRSAANDGPLERSEFMSAAGWRLWSVKLIGDELRSREVPLAALLLIGTRPHMGAPWLSYFEPVVSLGSSFPPDINELRILSGPDAYFILDDDQENWSGHTLNAAFEEAKRVLRDRLDTDKADQKFAALRAEAEADSYQGA